MDAATRDRVLALAGIVAPRVEERGHPHPGQHYTHGWVPVAGDALNLSGRIDLDPGESLASSSQQDFHFGGAAKVAVTEVGGQRTVRLGIGDDVFAQDPWKGANKGATVKLTPEQTRHLSAAVQEAAAKAKADNAAADRLEAEHAAVQQQRRGLGADLFQTPDPVKQAEHDRLMAHEDDLSDQLETTGAIGLRDVATIPGQWGDVKVSYDIEDAEPTVHVDVVPHTPADADHATEGLSLEPSEVGKFVKLLDSAAGDAARALVETFESRWATDVVEDADGDDLEDESEDDDDLDDDDGSDDAETEPVRSAADRDRLIRLLPPLEYRYRQSDNTGTGGSGSGPAPATKQDQSKHPHVASGPKGGQFTSKGGGESKAAPKAKAASTPSVPQPPATPRTMKPGDSGEDVRYAQYAMSLLGFHVNQNGSYDAQTAAAVKEIQSRLGMAKPNGHLSAAQLHKLQDAVRLSPCVGQSRSFALDLGETRELGDDGETRHRSLALLGIPVRPLPPDDDNTIDDETRGILDAISEWVERQADGEERAHDVSKELRIPGGKGGGRWTKNPIGQAISDALDAWGKGKGPDDPFTFDGKPIDREPLRRAAVARGITLKRGASRDDIVAALLGGVRDEVKTQRAERQKRLGSSKFSIDHGGKRIDVAVYTGTDPNAPTLREISSANRPGRVITSQPDLAGLEQWANDNGHTDVAQWAAGERARKEAKSAPKPAKAAPKAARAPVTPPGATPAEVLADLERRLRAVPGGRKAGFGSRSPADAVVLYRDRLNAGELQPSEVEGLLQRLLFQHSDAGGAVDPLSQRLLQQSGRQYQLKDPRLAAAIHDAIDGIREGSSKKAASKAAKAGVPAETTANNPVHGLREIATAETEYGPKLRHVRAALPDSAAELQQIAEDGGWTRAIKGTKGGLKDRLAEVIIDNPSGTAPRIAAPPPTPRTDLDRARERLASVQLQIKTADNPGGFKWEHHAAEAQRLREEELPQAQAEVDRLEREAKAAKSAPSAPAKAPATKRVPKAAKAAPKPKSMMSQLTTDERRVARQSGLPPDHPLAKLADRIDNAPTRAEAESLVADLHPDDLKQVARELSIGMPAGMDATAMKDHVVQSVIAFGNAGALDHLAKKATPSTPHPDGFHPASAEGGGPPMFRPGIAPRTPADPFGDRWNEAHREGLSDADSAAFAESGLTLHQFVEANRPKIGEATGFRPAVIPRTPADPDGSRWRQASLDGFSDLWARIFAESGQSYEDWRKTHEPTDKPRGFRPAGGARPKGEGGAPAGTAVVGRDISHAVDYAALPPNYDLATNTDPALAEIRRRQGFDGPPTVVSQADFDAAVKRGDVQETWRAFHSSPYSSITTEEMADQYRAGDLYAGTGINGNGTYVGLRQSDVHLYGSTLARIGLRRDARIISAEDLDAEMDRYFATAPEQTAQHRRREQDLLKALERARSPRARANARRTYREDMYGPDLRSRLLAVQRDPGRFAALRGYDAITISKERSPDHHAEMIILNRTATIVQEA